MNATLYSSLLAINNTKNNSSRGRGIVYEGCASLVNPPTRHLPTYINSDMAYDPDQHIKPHQQAKSHSKDQHHSPNHSTLETTKQQFVDLILERESGDQQWGFRLQGGKDYRSQFVVKSIKPKSPSEDKLQKADIITKINGFETKGMSHADAIEIIKCSKTSLPLQISRACSNISVMSPLSLINFKAAFSH